MSAPGAYRFAAWPGLAPQTARFERAPDDVAERVAAAMNVGGIVERLANASGADGLFRLSEPDGSRHFIKVIPAERAAEVEAAEALASWLKERGAPVLPAQGLPRAFGDALRLVVYPYVDGRPPSPTVEDARALGAALAALHRELSAHPEVERWKEDTRRRARALDAIRARLASGALRAGHDPGRLARLAQDETIELEPRWLGGRETPLHGDLNLFNVLMTAGGPLFLDLEDVRLSVLPAVFDVAKLCERAILVQEASDEPARRALRAFLGAYAQASFAGPPIEPRELPPVLRTLALRALCTLADIDPRGGDRAEWEKFFFLMEAAGSRPAVFADGAGE